MTQAEYDLDRALLAVQIALQCAQTSGESSDVLDAILAAKRELLRAQQAQFVAQTLRSA
jgi:hypothetical protein